MEKTKVLEPEGPILEIASQLLGITNLKVRYKMIWLGKKGATLCFKLIPDEVIDSELTPDEQDFAMKQPLPEWCINISPDMKRAEIIEKE